MAIDAAPPPSLPPTPPAAAVSAALTTTNVRVTSSFRGARIVLYGAVLDPSQKPSDVVVISQDADQRSEANLLLLSPARFLAMPSIAFRLALAAVGDARAAQSLVYLNAHDVAAGHALLLAAASFASSA